MGYFKETMTEKITLPSDANYWVEVKTKFTYGDSKKFLKANDNGELDQEVAADIFLKEAIIAWNLDDDNNAVLPITDESIALLDTKDAFYIIEKAGGTVEEKKDKVENSLKESGATSMEIPLPGVLQS